MSYSDRVRETYQQELNTIREAGLFKQERFIHSRQGADIDVEFPTGADIKKVINVCANNYLGLSSHPEVLKAAHEGLDTRGYGMSSVRFICGSQDIHKELEKVVTDFLGTEDTILFPSCMDANAGVFEALLTKDDIMISDRLVHASIVDGMRLCSAEHDTYKQHHAAPIGLGSDAQLLKRLEHYIYDLPDHGYIWKELRHLEQFQAA